MSSPDKYKYHRLSGKEKEALVERIVSVISENEKVLLAILFGSFVELPSFRDIDVAVYAPKMSLEELMELSAKLELALAIPVDVVPLDQIPPKFRERILKKGRVIYERMPGIYEALVMLTQDELHLLRCA